jgi:hypothetical protein
MQGDEAKLHFALIPVGVLPSVLVSIVLLVRDN